MSLLARTSRFSIVATCLTLVACVASPSLSTSSKANGGPVGPGGASVEPGGMVLVPEVILDEGGLTPTAENPTGKGEALGGKGDGKGDKGDKGGHGADAGAGGGNGGTTPGPSAPPEDAGAATPPATAPVVVAAFWLDATETSVESYRRCVASGACSLPEAAAGCTLNDGLETHPVNCVTLEQARVFCTWSHKRLPTNDEYVAAVAGTMRRSYPWGADAPAATRLNACGPECAAAGLYAEPDAFPRTAPTSSFPDGRTPDGAYDLAGNVAEWVEAGSASLVRGGSYEDVLASSVSVSGARSFTGAAPSVGFRCAADSAAR
jgi:hypothetical protein